MRHSLRPGGNDGRAHRRCFTISRHACRCLATNAPTHGESGWLWRGASEIGKTSIRHQLKQQKFKSKKSMGQNFMEDGETLERIVRLAGLSGDSLVVEVGPGTGALTRKIMASGARVRAVEKDDRLFACLHRTLARHGDLGDGLAVEDADADGDGDEDESEESIEEAPRIIQSADGKLEILHDDVLKVDLAGFASGFDTGRDAKGTEAKPTIMANLPYNITRDFLRKALPLGDAYTSLVLMLQHEAAVRLVQSTPGSPDWRAMNVIVQFYSTPSYLFRVDRRLYVPRPKVDGAVVEFALKSSSARPSVPSEADFVSLVKRGHLQRRKVLTNSLRPLLEGDEIRECLVSVGLSPESRAQELGLEHWVALSWAVHECLQAK
jgi:16S rRNA (adenine1518-N6/adenine1519-N6)-dimethyltransferase